MNERPRDELTTLLEAARELPAALFGPGAGGRATAGPVRGSLRPPVSSIPRASRRLVGVGTLPGCDV